MEENSPHWFWNTLYCLLEVLRWFFRIRLRPSPAKNSKPRQTQMSAPFLIDQSNVAQELGYDLIIKLSTEFYNRVYSDPDDWFRLIFPQGPKAKENAIQNQHEFLYQRFGGEPLYSKRKGHPALRARHAPFKVTNKSAERWLEHMKASMDAVGISKEAQVKLSEFFEHTAYFLVNTEDEPQQNQS